MNEILFYTCANRNYEDFAPLYAFSILAHVAGAVVEIGVEDESAFRLQHKQALALIGSIFGPSQLHVHSVSWQLPSGRPILPNTVRFTSVPHTKTSYVYIGDIDIIILEPDLLQKHLDHMRRTGLPYSNSVRPGTNRLSGLHFTRSDSYYPLPDLSDLNLASDNDEMVLYEIVRRRGLPPQDREWYRPVHGIHVSPNRSPEPRANNAGGELIPGWGISGYVKEWRTFTARPDYKEFYFAMSPRIREVINKINAVTNSISDMPSSEARPCHKEDSVKIIEPAAFRLTSQGDWNVRSFTIPKVDQEAALQFSVEPGVHRGPFEAHILVRPHGDRTRYRWIMAFRGVLEEKRDFYLAFKWMSVVGDIALSDCSELLIRIRATGSQASEVNVTGVSLESNKRNHKAPPVPAGVKPASLRILAGKYRQRQVVRSQELNPCPSSGISAICPGFGSVDGGQEVQIFIPERAIPKGATGDTVKVRLDGWSTIGYARVLNVHLIADFWVVSCVMPPLPVGPTVRAVIPHRYEYYPQCVEVSIETTNGWIGGGSFAYLSSVPARGEPLLIYPGCESDILPGWINFDRRPIVADGEAVLWEFHRGLRMFQPDSVDAITVSHMLCYIPVSEHEDFLNECFRVLKVGGVLRITEDNYLVHPAFENHYYVGPTSPLSMRQALENVGFLTYDQYPDTTNSEHTAIMRIRHMELWDQLQFDATGMTGIYFIEGVRPSLHYQIGVLRPAHPLEAGHKLFVGDFRPTSGVNPVFNIRDVRDPDCSFVADPFLIERDGSLYMFYEQRASPRAHISVASSEDGIKWADHGAALKEPFHLSFPYVFQDGGDVFMVPETSAACEVRLYRAELFPTKWVQLTTLLEGKPFCDSCVFMWGGLWWLFTHVEQALYLYSSKHPSGPYIAHPQNPVCVGTRHSRPAGRVIVIDGELYRFSQDCTRSYGESVACHRIARLTTEQYEEVVIADPFLAGPDPERFRSWDMKIHHVDMCRRADGSWIVVFDGTSEQSERLRDFKPLTLRKK